MYSYLLNSKLLPFFRLADITDQIRYYSFLISAYCETTSEDGIFNSKTKSYYDNLPLYKRNISEDTKAFLYRFSSFVYDRKVYISSPKSVPVQKLISEFKNILKSPTEEAEKKFYNKDYNNTITSNSTQDVIMSDKYDVMPSEAEAKLYWDNNNTVMRPEFGKVAVRNTDSLAAILDSVSDFKDVVKVAAMNEDIFDGFGLNNSSKYRARFLELCTKKGLSRKETLTVIMLCSVMKQKKRIIDDIDKVKMDKAELAKVKAFISENMVQKTSELRNQTDRFAVVHVPSSFPGLDIFFWAVFCRPSDLTLVKLKDRVTFSQLHLDALMQRVAKQGYDKYWQKTVVDKNAVLPPQSREDFYANQVGDTYRFVLPNMKEDEREEAYDKVYVEKWLKDMGDARAGFKAE